MLKTKRYDGGTWRLNCKVTSDKSPNGDTSFKAVLQIGDGWFITAAAAAIVGLAAYVTFGG